MKAILIIGALIMLAISVYVYIDSADYYEYQQEAIASIIFWSAFFLVTVFLLPNGKKNS